MLRRLQELPGFATHCLRGYAFWTEELSACSGSPGSSVWKSTQQGPLPLGEMKGSLVSRSVGRVGWAENAIPVCSFFQKRPRSWPRKPAWPSKKTATKNLEKKKKHQARQVPASWRQDRPASWLRQTSKLATRQTSKLANKVAKTPASWLGNLWKEMTSKLAMPGFFVPATRGGKNPEWYVKVSGKISLTRESVFSNMMFLSLAR